jgi:acetyl-CoA carboxylase biotin carboxyl carrier protein
VETVEVLLRPRVGVDLLAHRGEIVHRTVYITRVPRLRAIGRRRYLLSRSSGGDRHLEDEMTEIEAHITGTVWKIECAVGDAIEEGDTVAILESMKMEMPVEAEDAGTVVEIRCEEGQAVNEGDTLVVLD